MNKQKFNTSNGVYEFNLKIYDGSQVPVGYYYESDMFGRWVQLKELIKKSVLPVIQNFIYDVIPKYFYLNVNSLSVRVFAGPYKIEFDECSLEKSFEKLNNEFKNHDTHNFDFFINIEFMTCNAHVSLKKYGCQIYISVGSETIQDLEAENDFSVWYLYMGDEKTLIDVFFTKEQENKIIGTFLGRLWQSEDII